MAHYNFRKDLVESEVSVKRTVQLLEAKGAKLLETCFTKDYDIKMFINDRELTVEVKHDIMSTKTGNVAIELMSRDKPSGITTSKADMWVYQIGEDFYAISRAQLQKEAGKTGYRIVNGGDKNTSVIILIPVTKFVSLCKKLNDNEVLY